MVAPDQVDPVGVAHLEGEEQQDRLDRVEAPVHVVAQEEVVLLGHPAPRFEEVQQVPELAVDVAAYNQGRVQPLDVALFDEDFLDLVSCTLMQRLMTSSSVISSPFLSCSICRSRLLIFILLGKY